MKTKDLKAEIHITENSIAENEVYLKALESEKDELTFKLQYSQSYTERQKYYDKAKDKTEEIRSTNHKLKTLREKLQNLRQVLKRKEHETT